MKTTCILFYIISVVYYTTLLLLFSSPFFVQPILFTPSYSFVIPYLQHAIFLLELFIPDSLAYSVNVLLRSSFKINGTLNYNLTRRFDFLPKSSSGVNWGRTLRGDIITQVNCKISGGHTYWLLYPGGWFVRSMDSQHPGSSKPMSLLNLLLSGVICMYRASLIFNSRFLLALPTTLTSSHLMGWCCCQALFSNGLRIWNIELCILFKCTFIL